MKKLMSVMVIVVIIGCCNVKTVYTDGKLNYQDKSIQKLFEKFDAESENKSVVVFTGGFENNNVEISNGKKLIFNKTVNTVPQLGFGGFEVVNNDQRVQIHIYSSKRFKITLDEKDLKKI